MLLACSLDDDDPLPLLVCTHSACLCLYMPVSFWLCEVSIYTSSLHLVKFWVYVLLCSCCQVWMPPCNSTRCRSGIYRVWICSSSPLRNWKSWACVRSDTRSSYWTLWRNSALWWGRESWNHVCLCTLCVHSSALCIQEAVCGAVL